MVTSWKALLTLKPSTHGLSLEEAALSTNVHRDHSQDDRGGRGTTLSVTDASGKEALGREPVGYTGWAYPLEADYVFPGTYGCNLDGWHQKVVVSGSTALPKWLMETQMTEWALEPKGHGLGFCLAAAPLWASQPS